MMPRFEEKLDVRTPVDSTILEFTDNVASGKVYYSNGTPETNIAAAIGSLCIDTSTATLYRKKSGAGATGWVPDLFRKEGQDDLGTVSGTVNVNFDDGSYDNKKLVLGDDVGDLFPYTTREGLYHITISSSSNTSRSISPNITFGAAFENDSQFPAFVDSTTPITVAMYWNGSKWSIPPVVGREEVIAGANIPANWTPDSGFGVINRWRITGDAVSSKIINPPVNVYPGRDVLVYFDDTQTTAHTLNATHKTGVPDWNQSNVLSYLAIGGLTTANVLTIAAGG